MKHQGDSDDSYGNFTGDQGFARQVGRANHGQKSLLTSKSVSDNLTHFEQMLDGKHIPILGAAHHSSSVNARGVARDLDEMLVHTSEENADSVDIVNEWQNDSSNMLDCDLGGPDSRMAYCDTGEIDDSVDLVNVEGLRDDDYSDSGPNSPTADYDSDKIEDSAGLVSTNTTIDSDDDVGEAPISHEGRMYGPQASDILGRRSGDEYPANHPQDLRTRDIPSRRPLGQGGSRRELGDCAPQIPPRGLQKARRNFSYPQDPVPNESAQRSRMFKRPSRLVHYLTRNAGGSGAGKRTS